MADFDASDWIWPDVSQGRQPTGPWEIDCDAAITQGLRVVWEDGEVKGVCNAPMPLGSRVVLPDGAASQCSGTSQARFPTGSFPTADADVPFGTKIFWVRMAANNTTIRSVIGGGSGALGLRFTSGGGLAILSVNVKVYATSNSLALANEMVCVALSGTGKLSTIDVYKNGALVQTLSLASVTTAAFGNNVYLGSSGAASNYFDGAILRYMDFDRVLSANEIKSLYDNPQQVKRTPFSAGVYMPSVATAAGVPIAGAGAAITNVSAAIASASSATGSSAARADAVGATSARSAIQASASAATSSAAAITVTTPAASIVATNAAAPSSSGALQSRGSVSAVGLAVPSGVAVVTAGTLAAAIAGTGTAVTSGTAAIRSASTLSASKAAGTSSSASASASAQVSGSTQARTSATAAISAGSSPSAAVSAAGAAVTQAVAALIAQCTLAATNAAVASGRAALSTGAPDTPGELVLTTTKRATIGASVKRAATITVGVLNRG